MTGHSGFASDRARQKSLSGSGRPDQQHALGTVCAHGEKALGALEVRDDVAQIRLRFARAADICQREMT